MMNSTPSWDVWETDWQARETAKTLNENEKKLLNRIGFLKEARPAQRPPPGDWRSWLFMGGRGAGKTRAGAEWTRFAALFGGCGRIALVAPTLSDVREVMVEGSSGLRALPGWAEDRPVYESTRRRLVWPNGAEAYGFSAEDPDSLRGPQFDAAWCDEAAAWNHGVATWDMLQLALRLGAAPRVVATTTPRPVPLIRRLVSCTDGSVAITRGGTRENAAHLAPGFVDLVEAAYGGTPLGRQELLGELVEVAEGALWTREMIARARAGAVPDAFDEVVVAVDPPVSSGRDADACGIVAAGRIGSGRAAQGFVLADGSVQGCRPLDWAGRVAALARQAGASRVIAEANQGGEMVRATLETAGCDVPVRLVHARAGKAERAAPVAALYAQGRVAHGGVFPALEDELCAFGTDGLTSSPDRADALVWALWALMIDGRERPRIWGL